MSTILDALRRAQKADGDTVGEQPGEQQAHESTRTARDPAPRETSATPTAPPEQPASAATQATAARANPAAASAAALPTQTAASVLKPKPKPRAGKAASGGRRFDVAAIWGGLKALPLPTAVRDWRVAVIVVAGLAVGLVLAGMFSDDESELALPDRVADKVATAAVTAAAQPSGKAVKPSRPPADPANVAAHGEPGTSEKPAAPAESAEPVGDARRGKRGTDAAKPVKPAQIASAGASPTIAPTVSSHAGAGAVPIAGRDGAVVATFDPAAGLASANQAASAPPPPTRAAATPAVPQPVAPPGPRALAVAAQGTAPSTAPKVGSPTSSPYAGMPSVPGMAAVSPSGETSPIPTPAVAPGLAQGAEPGAATGGGEDTASSSSELLEAAPEGAPHVDLLFIRWKPVASERVASIRTVGQRIVVLHEDDVIEGMKVSRIEPSGVEFQWRGQRFMVLAARY